MDGAWNKLKKSLSMKLSFRTQASETAPQPPLDLSANISESDSRSTTPRLSSSSVSRLSRSISTRSSKKTCAICLTRVKPGQGQAIFTAECSHSFHFSCIASSVKHGNHLCPICRSKWKDIPFQCPSNSVDPQCNGQGHVAHSLLEGLRANIPRNIIPPPLPPHEPRHFSDDESLPFIPAEPTSIAHPQTLTLKAIPELPSIAASDSFSTFAVLVGVRAPPLLDDARRLERAPIDLVTVLDISGSMAGSKLSLLKRAVKFVIQNLSPFDRLAIVAFSSGAQRIFPLRRMSETGREDAIFAINSLQANGGTNIVEGLKKGVRILEERREHNPVASIILLSDGKDTFNCDNTNQRRSLHKQSSSNPRQVLNYLNLLPVSICPNSSEVVDEIRPPTIPVHTFGFGLDHDSVAMHAISDASGGTFSFIESIGTVQDAFARCIGGLLSVVAQELRLILRSTSLGVDIGSIPSGRYLSEISHQGQHGVVEIGDLYADEEKEFLVYLSVPVASGAVDKEKVEKTSLLEVVCSFKDSVSKEMVQIVLPERVQIRRPEVLFPTDMIVSLEVDRQRNRLWVAEGIAEAQELAEMGNLEGAQTVLADRRSTLLTSASAQAGDGLCNWLEAELIEIRRRMATMELYEHTGRAYVLSGLSSHSWQRATTRGDSTTTPTLPLSGEDGNSSNTGLIGYDTPTMVSMVMKSQTLNISNPHEQVRRLNKSCGLTPRRE
ncbi:E3 ubiquitin-protein ligase WAV3-like [Cornus florida]|uniref:E3 ubiquitin-protein ligase WAV3-like n=1 Tax=Cornus florida TaxID=4283 RepID=UPI0028A1BDF2|nr:E3 ubiquitin-protein ligase WAV3-like [Cornus florida]